MAYTYLIINCVFLCLVLIGFRRQFRRPRTAWWVTLLALLLLTLVFDNLMISLGFFSYAPSLITGISVGVAPIEDFFYAICAAVVVPLAWQRFLPSNKRSVRANN